VSKPEVVVLPTGTANLASVLATFARLGAQARIAAEPAMVRDAERVVLPGVGTFGATMAGLRASGLGAAIAARARQGAHVLAMCVGLQVLFETSEESPGSAGLGVLSGGIGRFPDTVRVPQFGWNRIEPEPGCRYLEPGYAYFANSYRALAAPGCKIARAAHGETFVAAAERGPLLACQFHPELSGAFGHRLIARWLEG
jgi:imidazole glycerol phosphate synthase glutamine amidotransferase subunit